MLYQPFIQLRNLTIATALILGMVSHTLAAPAVAGVAGAEVQLGLIFKPQLNLSPNVDPMERYRGFMSWVGSLDMLMQSARQLLDLNLPRPGDPLTLYPV